MNMTIDRDNISANTLSFALGYCRLLLQYLPANQAMTQPFYTASSDIFLINELETRRYWKITLSSFRQCIGVKVLMH
ncbi:hypothetical protein FE392_09595 [Xenorhabdus sp. 12]|uniref:Uncharacterized protein n=1 Tax=Xenorhabdus santafensis TaxID=2582833 RepID=A0ABU4S9V1_9GAMM|nr:hypothetical protein [Xenorhabdus sp. 12]MDX7987582.1 hypothetical protein [Xenorhabdus sp. 12]